MTDDLDHGDVRISRPENELAEKVRLAHSRLTLDEDRRTLAIRGVVECPS